MKTLIRVYKDGKYFVAEDVVTNVADQGVTEQEAVDNLKKGLEEQYKLLMELMPKSSKVSFLDITVDKHAQASRSIG